MDFNIFLLRFGLDPTNFTNAFFEPIKTEFGFIYEVEQRTDIRECPTCHSSQAHIHDYDYIEIECSDNNHIRDILRVRKVRFKCLHCHNSYTPSLQGIARFSKVSTQQKQLIMSDFMGKLTFTEIGQKYHLTKSRIIQLFDEYIKYVPRLTMPRALCIDEIRFSEELDQNYVCVLTNFDTGKIVDIVRNRKMAYLREYFASIPLKERETTKVLYPICMKLMMRYAATTSLKPCMSSICSMSSRS